MTALCRETRDLRLQLLLCVWQETDLMKVKQGCHSDDSSRRRAVTLFFHLTAWITVVHSVMSDSLLPHGLHAAHQASLSFTISEFAEIHVH